jgi:2-oxoglutarate dehydrogenase E1 component
VSKSSLEEMMLTSGLSGSNAAYIESLYDSYLIDPSAVDARWQKYFAALPIVSSAVDIPRCEVEEQFRALAKAPFSATAVAPAVAADKQFAVDALVSAYRNFGHTKASIDPLELGNYTADHRLDPAFYQLDLNDSTQYLTHGLLPQATADLKTIYAKLEENYAHNVGFEFSQVADSAEEEWLQAKIESIDWTKNLANAEAIEVLQQLIATDGLEKFLDAKYVGQTRFSVSGTDSVIPFLCKLFNLALDMGVTQSVIGMAHRGRVNVMLNVLGKLPEILFNEFSGASPVAEGSGDVKYHMGYSCDMGRDGKKMHIALGFNPSHLEFINSVGMGIVRAKQDDSGLDHSKVLPVLLHGDSAFCGEGIVYECMQMSGTRAYSVAGSVHVIINNQVGFTTSDLRDVRTSRYASAPANLVHAPVFHVNCEDLAAVINVAKIALEYRMQFKKDVVVDLIGFRRPGHNEADEPRATQPVMYKKIDSHLGVCEQYIAKLIERGVCTDDDVKNWRKEYREKISAANKSLALLPIIDNQESRLKNQWAQYLGNTWRVPYDAELDAQELQDLLHDIYANLPEDLELQSRVADVVKNRLAMSVKEKPLDWGTAEILAYALLLVRGHGIRFTGQDSRRGTFFHRHAALFDQNTGEAFEPLRHVSDTVTADIYDSILAEAGVVGFEYGYSTAAPNKLVLWEAQFGDFANTAQVLFDQFVTAGWEKWNRLSGLVILLPHGYAGQGPEHSSGRLERFLQLSAENNIQVCIPSTPAQMFNLLIRQLLRPYRTPLIVFTPKSLLRHPKMISSFADCARGVYDLVIDDVLAHQGIERVILCSGKVYYDLIEMREAQNITNIAVVRIEQLYPFPYEELKSVLAAYSDVKTIVWCQEEPKNQGAWFITEHRLRECVSDHQTLAYVGRAAMASTAPGYALLFKEQQEALLREALCID